MQNAAMIGVGIALVLILLVVISASRRRRYYDDRGYEIAAAVRRSNRQREVTSDCDHARTFRPRWGQDGWETMCRDCGTMLYLGDDHDNPPPDALTEAEVADMQRRELRRSSGERRVQISAALGAAFSPSTNEKWDACGGDSYKAFAEQIMPEQILRRSLTQAEIESGEYLPVTVDLDDEEMHAPPMPNMGGEGNPDYQGPHFESVHGVQTRFAPYDVLRQPEKGRAVTIVGGAGMVGPIADAEKKS